jgi:hypothetical protein
LAVGLVALAGCGEGGSKEDQMDRAGTEQPSQFKASSEVTSEASAETPKAHHESHYSSKKRKQEKPESQKPQGVKSSPSAGADPITAEEFEDFSGTDKENWEIAYGVCAVTPESQLAKEFHTEQNWAAIGHAYGEDYREPFNIAAEEGCMAALNDSHAEREAAFKMMEG